MFKKLLNPGNYNGTINFVLLLNRIVIGSCMLTHGLGKLTKLLGPEPIAFADPFRIGMGPSLALTVFAEVFCSGLLIIGFLTRLATVPLITTMMVAIFIIHAADDFGKKEMAVLYLLVYVTLLLAGAGKYSIDNLLSKKSKVVKKKV